MADHYTVTLTWEPTDQCFVARVAELPGCVTDGPTRLQATKAVAVAIRDWLAAASSQGLPTPVPTEHVASLSIRDVRVLSGLSAAALRAYIARGDLQAVRIGRDWRISPWALADFERNRRPVRGKRPPPLLSETELKDLKGRARKGDRAARVILRAARGETYRRMGAQLGISEGVARSIVARFRRKQAGTGANR